jgi:hypothetical protein
MPGRGNKTGNSLLDELGTDGPVTLENVMAVMMDERTKSEERHAEVIKRLDNKCKALEVKIKGLETVVDDKAKLIDKLTAENLSQADLIDAIDKRLSAMKNCFLHNFVELQRSRQRQRQWGLRVSNVTAAALGVVKISARAIYSALFVPAFEAAVVAGELSSVPSFDRLFDLSHVLYTVKDSDRECWQFAFSSRWLLHLFLRMKKDVLNSLNKTALKGVSYAEATRPEKLKLLRASLDMTPFNRRLIANLVIIPEVGMARVSGERVVICYKEDMKPGAKLQWHPVLNPLADNLPGMLEALSPLEECSADLLGREPIALKMPDTNTIEEPEDRATQFKRKAKK